MTTTKNNLVMHDTPIRLVIQVVMISLLFGVLYLGISVASEIYQPFDATPILGSLFTLDFTVFLGLVLLQQCITIYLLLKWMNLTYTFDDVELIVRKGALFRRTITIPFNKISSIQQYQSLLGRMFGYSTINISLLDRPNFIVIPYMTQSEQVLRLLGFAENVCT